MFFLVFEAGIRLVSEGDRQGGMPESLSGDTSVCFSLITLLHFIILSHQTQIDDYVQSQSYVGCHQVGEKTLREAHHSQGPCCPGSLQSLPGFDSSTEVIWYTETLNAIASWTKSISYYVHIITIIECRYLDN